MGRELLRVRDPGGDPRWALRASDAPARLLPAGVRLADLLVPGAVERFGVDTADLEPLASEAPLLAPVDSYTEVWAAGVTYERSLYARVEESATPDIYDRVYLAERPELFAKALGWRVSGPGQPIAIRADSTWDVPEPELAAVLDREGTVFGWTICNDVSSRSIEAENPLYLPQAKVYLGSCALGPAIVLADSVPDPYQLAISLSIGRDGATAWSGTTSTSLLRRRVEQLAEYLFRANAFPDGVVLSTGTSLVPGPEFTLEAGDTVHITIDRLGALTNPVVRELPQALTPPPGIDRRPEGRDTNIV